jgi:carboxylesterase type B
VLKDLSYRLGVAGFLTSKELRNAGLKANNGMHDQRTALRWIKKNITGFGGDPEEITTVGESAGASAYPARSLKLVLTTAVSVTMLMCSEEPFMKRCLATGGSVLLLAPSTLEVAEATYEKLVDAFGLVDKSPEERVQAILNMPQDDLWRKIPVGASLLPVIDGETVIGHPNFAAISTLQDSASFPMPGRKWCESLMVGDSTLDANILAYMGIDARKSGLARTFAESVQNTLSSQPWAAKELLSSYNITPTTSDDDALLSILRFASEISFYAPARAFAQGWPRKCFLYHFNETIPWEGRFEGEAGHILDVAYLFQNYNKHLDEEQRKVARTYAEDFIKFVNGEDPWPQVHDDNMAARVYGPSSEGTTVKFVQPGLPREVGRQERVLKLGEKAGFDNVLAAFQNFFQGR